MRELVVGEATFIRSDDSLPQEAHGIRYNVGAAKEKNIMGNHYAYTSIDTEGVNYWDNSDYSELTLQANLGYRHKKYRTVMGRCSNCRAKPTRRKSV
ncbi:surface lipoprotein assembly modifier [Psychrobacter sp. ENNN9_III]|uniref:surface lipoprotein assembly modifier n=1 Tax=Psychrobacter sp. ENNN9_III TaxID=1254334 RepID=UPI00222814A5|nr:surface lipoprotein assembly modifier [Psychrobacter sp. ENNN9_III]